MKHEQFLFHIIIYTSSRQLTMQTTFSSNIKHKYFTTLFKRLGVTNMLSYFTNHKKIFFFTLLFIRNRRQKFGSIFFFGSKLRFWRKCCQKFGWAKLDVLQKSILFFFVFFHMIYWFELYRLKWETIYCYEHYCLWLSVPTDSWRECKL